MRRLLAITVCLAASLLAISGIAAPRPTTSARRGPIVAAAALPAPPAGVWSIVDSPNGSIINDLGGVSCTGPNECWAVGRTRSGSIWQTLTIRWNGSGWSFVASPNSSSSTNNTLASVACTSADDCWAVGDHSLASNIGFAQPLIEHWNGTAWTIDNSLLLAPNQQDAALNAVACVTSNNCWAVGYGLVGDFNQTLIERWDGTSWTAVTSANTSARESNRLNAVTCIAANDCWAVGTHDVGTPVGGGVAPQATLTQHWDGTAWTIVASPNQNSTWNWLTAVACASANDCHAVGYYGVGTIWNTLAMHWNGSAWAIVDTPNPNPSQDNVFNAVSCTAASDCWTAGYFNSTDDPYNGTFRTLTAHWDGNSWNGISSPNRDTYQSNMLNAITCASANECWAVGVSDTPDAVTLVEHYVVPLLRIDAVARLTNHNYFITGRADPLRTINIEASTNLVDWSNPAIGSTTSDATGVFTFEDSSAPAYSARFYRAVIP